MLVGHIGAAMVAKQSAPRLSLGTLVLASLVADVLLFTFVLTGLEDVRFRTSAEPAAYYLPLHVAFSHSLVTMAVVGVAAGAFCARRTRSSWAAAVLGMTTVSHWVLDVATHPVLPVSPGWRVYLGSTLARWPMIVLAFEAALWVMVLFLYVRDSKSMNAAGRYVFWGGVLSWSYISWAIVAGPPRRPDDAPIEMLIVLGLIVVWSYWMDRARQVKAERD
jgi:membrane-bound metal-dependent hydrolase YbcI (DUF457 family)